MKRHYLRLRSLRNIFSGICFCLAFHSLMAGPPKYEPQMEMVNGRRNPTPEVVRQALKYPPETAIPFFRFILADGTPQARELARTTLIAYPGWQEYFDRRLSEAVEFWKAHQTKRMIVNLAGKYVEVLADSDGAGNARSTATRTFETLAAIKHPSAIPIIAKHLDADGDTYWDFDNEVVPLNWHAAGALATLVRAGINIPGAPPVNKKLVVDEWKEWWRTHRQDYEKAVVPPPVPTPVVEPMATPAPPQAKSEEPMAVSSPSTPAVAESSGSFITLAIIAGLALIAALVMLVALARGRTK